MAGVISNIQQTSYNARKAASQALMDLALFLSNVTQLKSIFDGDMGMGPMAKVVLGLIILSLILQVTIGILLIIILDIEGALMQLKRKSATEAGTPLTAADATLDEVTNTEPTEPMSNEPPNDRKFKLASRARRVNTACTILIFLVLCLNLAINGIDITSPNTLQELMKAYNITLQQ